jgi:hypothetical protein
LPDEIAEWQDRPLEAVYPLVFFDALRVKVRDEGTVRNKAVYIALGIRAAVSSADLSPRDRAHGSTAARRSSVSGSSRTPPGPAGPSTALLSILRRSDHPAAAG